MGKIDDYGLRITESGLRMADFQMISPIEEIVGKRAIVERLPEQPADVPQTWADVSKANKLFGYKPTITFKKGVEQFVKWQKAK